MPIGDLNKRIQIQYEVKSSDGMGGWDSTWTDACTCWAALWPISAKETIQSMKETMTISMRIRIRYRSVLRPDWRIRFGNRFFNIVSIVNPEERNELLDLMCKEAV